MREVIAKRVRRQRRKLRIRGDIRGTAACPRLTVFRSARQIYAQLIDDVAGHTLAAVSTVAKDLRGDVKCGGNKAAARQVGEQLGARAIQKGIKEAVFDRNGYRYHGRVKELADGARKAGLKF